MNEDLTSSTYYSIPASAGPCLVYIETGEGGGMCRVDQEVPESPRERAILRALLGHALRMLDETERPTTMGARAS